MGARLFDEFKEEFGYLFDDDEMDEIWRNWDSKFRNAIVLGIFERRPRWGRDRRALINWLDNHPDEFMIYIGKKEGRIPSVEEMII